MHFDYKIWRPMVCASLVVLSANFAHADSYSLENAVTAAQRQDPWAVSYTHLTLPTSR